MTDKRPEVKIEACTANSIHVFIGDIAIYAVNCDDPIYQITTNGRKVTVKP